MLRFGESEHARAERLRQSILNRAFEGKLVPQDPSDEPATLRMERINTQRDGEAAKPVPRPRHEADRPRQGVLIE